MIALRGQKPQDGDRLGASTGAHGGIDEVVSSRRLSGEGSSDMVDDLFSRHPSLSHCRIGNVLVGANVFFLLNIKRATR